MVARLASIAKWYQKVAGSSPAVVIFFCNAIGVITIATTCLEFCRVKTPFFREGEDSSGWEQVDGLQILKCRV